MKSIYFLLLFPLIAAFSTSETPEQSVNRMLNKWHVAASEADFQSYFSYFTGDDAIFMGTDATEKWTISEFKPWAKPYFDRGSAWTFIPENRSVYFNENNTIAWFDEVLSSSHMGECRGTGVLILTDGEWKIAHYNLSVPIPNDLLGDFVEMIANSEDGQDD
ncbi:nuclear transport factor 2 family protein [Phaeocystidibacter marisrubri]|uniref:Nuclear transport factor 2 family protein n=1 Tax=Phaeocystidibacter marisrubri TaxID=1577780 RepID=A0A6L3ZEC2_9FLAO|nr:nuclear transport factor 2 family protein [Phaeocystidibacter marisrubri]KAB2816193.1 nuclear transport factor 2 family protein [Phaeocystidibacter marisrubri]GGH67784.1 hypothetical protein GCM10011318_07150 [Phaeocystidibacter marisrubri]